MKQAAVKIAGIAAIVTAAAISLSSRGQASDLRVVPECVDVEDMEDRFRCYQNPQAYSKTANLQRFRQGPGGSEGPAPVEYVRICDAYGSSFFYIPGTETCLSVGGGPTYRGRTIPRTYAGTQFSPALGREVGIVGSQRSMRGAGLTLALFFPLYLPLLRQTGAESSTLALAGYVNASYVSFNDANKAAEVPNGANNVAFTYYRPNPATGSTGVFFGNTGQTDRIRTTGSWYEVEGGFNVPLTTFSGGPAQQTGAFVAGVFMRIGAVFSGLHVDHKVTQQSIAFPNHGMATGMKTQQYFAAPVVGLGLGAGTGRFKISTVASIAPGVLFANGSITQTVQCPFCVAPGDQAFSQTQSFNKSWFSYRASLEATASYAITSNLQLSGMVRYDRYARTAYVQNPITPNEQPARLRAKQSEGISLRMRLLRSF